MSKNFTTCSFSSDVMTTTSIQKNSVSMDLNIWLVHIFNGNFKQIDTGK